MKFLRLWGPVIVWMMVIFALSTRQRVSVSPQYVVNFLFFKTLHVIEYAILFVLNYRATKNFFAAFVLTVGYASTDEIHQRFVPTREGAVRDVIIDAIGAGIAWTAIVKLLPRAPKKLQKWARHLLTV